jgi:hypothetical protein
MHKARKHPTNTPKRRTLRPFGANHPAWEVTQYYMITKKMDQRYDFHPADPCCLNRMSV